MNLLSRLKDVASYAASFFIPPKYTWKKTSYIAAELESGNMCVPVFDLPKDHCSAYARLAAADLFGKDYSACYAWEQEV